MSSGLGLVGNADERAGHGGVSEQGEHELLVVAAERRYGPLDIAVDHVAVRVAALRGPNARETRRLEACAGAAVEGAPVVVLDVVSSDVGNHADVNELGELCTAEVAKTDVELGEPQAMGTRKDDGSERASSC